MRLRCPEGRRRGIPPSVRLGALPRHRRIALTHYPYRSCNSHCFRVDYGISRLKRITTCTLSRVAYIVPDAIARCPECDDIVAWIASYESRSYGSTFAQLFAVGCFGTS